MGHIAPNCKIKEIIAELDVGRRLKQQMINLIKTDSSSNSFREDSSDDQLLFIGETSSSNKLTSSSSQSSCDCIENCLYEVKQVNMISSESNFLIEIIENIPDPQLQKEYFKKYLEIQKQNKTQSF